ncbi:MAG: hypothetical protein AAFQ47_14140 [Pseudomonadota bacterium]
MVDAFRNKKSNVIAPRFGHPSRMDPDTRQITMLLLAHLMVFLIAMAHDEIVAEMVAEGWFLAGFAERCELLIGLALFLCWGALTVRLLDVVKEAARQTDNGETSP